jgi:hypothetical protein
VRTETPVRRSDKDLIHNRQVWESDQRTTGNPKADLVASCLAGVRLPSQGAAGTRVPSSYPHPPTRCTFSLLAPLGFAAPTHKWGKKEGSEAQKYRGPSDKVAMVSRALDCDSGQLALDPSSLMRGPPVCYR